LGSSRSGGSPWVPRLAPTLHTAISPRAAYRDCTPAMRLLLALSAACSSTALHVQTGHGQTERCPAEATIKGARLHEMEAAAECAYTQRLSVTLDSLRKDDAASWRKKLEETGHVIDTFLAPRFDWEVESEPYPWQDFDLSPSFVLRRNLDAAVQNISRVLASKQFPPTCRQQRMLAISDPARFLGSFAASLLWDFNMFETLLEHKGSPILGIYNSEEWVLEPRDRTFCDAPAPSGTGPQNRWLCFFLPLTNCSVEGDVLPMAASDQKVGLLVNAADGLPSTPAITWRDMMEHYSLSEKQEEQPEIAADDLGQMGGFIDTLHAHLGKDEEGLGAVQAFEQPAMRAAFLARNVLYRRNYRLRSLVAQEVAKHPKLEEVVEGKTDCIGVHMRRGDKVDDAYYCSLADPHNPAYWQAPGFNRTLDEVIDIAASLETTVLSDTPSRRAKIFIASDSGSFVQEHLEHANASLRKQVLSLGGQDNPFETKDSRLHELAVYWASQDIAATCKGLVINTDSKTSLVFKWMACSKQSHCPFVKDTAQARPQEEIDAAMKAWDNGDRPEGYKQRCTSSRLLGLKSGDRFRQQLWQ